LSVSTAAEVEFAAALEEISSTICGDFEQDGCGPVIIPGCPPPGTLACVDGQCVESP
jgi:hypothetical protein